MTSSGETNVSSSEQRILSPDELEMLIDTKGMRKAVKKLLEHDPEMQFTCCDERWFIEFSEAFLQKRVQMEARKQELIEQLQDQTFEGWEDRNKFIEEMCEISRELDRIFQWRQLVTKALNGSGI
jgi:uncharacterized protein (DUF849 family)